MRRLKNTPDFPLGIAFLALAGCKGNGLANEDILERSKSTNEIIWGVKYDTRLFGMMDIESRTVQGFDVDIAKAITKRSLVTMEKQNLLKSLLKLGFHY